MPTKRSRQAWARLFEAEIVARTGHAVSGEVWNTARYLCDLGMTAEAAATQLAPLNPHQSFDRR